MKNIQSKIISGIIVGIIYFFSYDWLYPRYRTLIDSRWDLNNKDHYILYTLSILIILSLIYLIIFSRLDIKKRKERYSWYTTSWIFAILIGFFIFFGLAFMQPPIIVFDGKIDSFIYFILFHIVLDPFVESRAYIRAHPPEYDSRSSSFGGYSTSASSQNTFTERLIRDQEEFEDRKQQERDAQYYADQADAARRMGNDKGLVDSYDSLAGRSWGEQSDADWKNGYDED